TAMVARPSPWRSAVSCLSIAIRSAIVKACVFEGLLATPMTRWSTSLTARLMMSMWPSVTGSNVPGYSPMRLSVMPCPPFSPSRRLFVLPLPGRLGNTFNRHHALAFFQAEKNHALSRAPLNADARHRYANGLPLVGDQHQMVGFFNRKSRDNRAIL